MKRLTRRGAAMLALALAASAPAVAQDMLRGVDLTCGLFPLGL